MAVMDGAGAPIVISLVGGLAKDELLHPPLMVAVRVTTPFVFFVRITFLHVVHERLAMPVGLTDHVMVALLDNPGTVYAVELVQTISSPFIK